MSWVKINLNNSVMFEENHMRIELRLVEINVNLSQEFIYVFLTSNKTYIDARKRERGKLPKVAAEVHNTKLFYSFCRKLFICVTLTSLTSVFNELNKLLVVCILRRSLTTSLIYSKVFHDKHLICVRINLTINFS